MRNNLRFNVIIVFQDHQGLVLDDGRAEHLLVTKEMKCILRE